MMTQREAAETLGIHFTVLNKLLKGTRPPGRETAIVIEEKTGIPVAAWSTRVGKRRKADRRSAKTANVGRTEMHNGVS